MRQLTDNLNGFIPFHTHYLPLLPRVV